MSSSGQFVPPCLLRPNCKNDIVLYHYHRLCFDLKFSDDAAAMLFLRPKSYFNFVMSFSSFWLLRAVWVA